MMSEVKKGILSNPGKFVDNDKEDEISNILKKIEEDEKKKTGVVSNILPSKSKTPKKRTPSITSSRHSKTHEVSIMKEEPKDK